MRVADKLKAVGRFFTTPDDEIDRSETIDWLSSLESVLDLGCGEGYYSRLLLRRGVDLVAMDMDADKLRTVGQGVARIREDAAHIPIRAASLGGVLCIYILEHLVNVRKCLIEIQRTLCENGRLVVLVPCRKGLPRIFGELFRMCAPPQENDSRFMVVEQNFSYQEIEELLQQHGFRIIESMHGEFVGTHVLRRMRRHSETLRFTNVVLSDIFRRIHLSFLLQNTMFRCVKGASSAS